MHIMLPAAYLKGLQCGLQYNMQTNQRDQLQSNLSKRLPPSHLKDEVGPGGTWAAPVAWDRAESSVASSAPGSSAPEQARLASE